MLPCSFNFTIGLQNRLDDLGKDSLEDIFGKTLPEFVAEGAIIFADELIKQLKGGEK